MRGGGFERQCEWTRGDSSQHAVPFVQFFSHVCARGEVFLSLSLSLSLFLSLCYRPRACRLKWKR